MSRPDVILNSGIQTTPMAIFNKPAEEPPQLSRRPAQTPADSALSIIAAGMKVVGDIEGSGVLKIEGTVEGSVRGARQLLLGRQGEIKGDVHAREIVVGGKVEGTVVAAERVEIQGTASVNGDIHTRTIVVLEGGVINGAVRMEERAPETRVPESKPQPAAVVR
jgi:cytoskeletal protein CcmA (bactofilin family)